MREIPLTKGLTAIIDDEDYDLVNQYKWFATNRKNMTEKQFLEWLESAFIADYEWELDDKFLNEIYNKLSLVIKRAIADHEQGKRVIHAKALRKKYSIMWFDLDGNERTLPELYIEDTTMKEIKTGYFKTPSFLSNAKLVNLTIIVEGGEG